MTTIRINNYETEVPDVWNEITRKQLLIIAEIMQDRLPVDEFLTKMLFVFTKWKLKRKNDDFVLIIKKNKLHFQSWQILKMLEPLSFMVSSIESENGEVCNINAKISINTTPYFKHKGKRFYGPSNMLFNLTFGEFITADMYFTGYMKNNDPELLNKLFATLYRRKDKDFNLNAFNYRGDKRELFNSHTVQRRSEVLKDAPQNLKMATLLFFNGCKIHLASVFTNVFEGGKSGSNKFGGIGLVAALNNGDVTKSETIRQQYLYDVLVHIDNTTRAYNEYLQKNKTKK